MASAPDTEVDLPDTEPDAREIEARAPLPQKLNDRYEIGALLGEGGMGEVRQCNDPVMERAVALKVIRRDRYARELEARFLREACVQAQLEHPSVVPVFDVARDAEGVPFFTMRKVDGVTLDEILRRRIAGDAATNETFSRHRLLTAFLQVCLTVDYAHTRGVLHRDLKPANIMFGDYGELYVLDWGLAKLTEVAGGPPSGAGGPVSVRGGQRTVAGSAMGTPAYMAPEQLAGGELDARADVFALGAVLFEILTLEQLFDEAAVARRPTDDAQSWEARPSVRAPHLQLPPEFDPICSRATARTPEERYPSARALHDVIAAYLGGERDIELRARLAGAHFARAEASRVADPALALREVQRALALAPEHPRGLELLVELVKATPAASAEAREHVVSEGLVRLRRAQPLGALLFAVPWLTVYPVICVLHGVASPWLAVVPPLAWALAGLAIMIDYRQSSQERVSYPVAAIMIAIALTTVVFGPLFIVPTLAVSAVTNHVLVSPRRLRSMAIVMGCAAVVIPTALAWQGTHDVYRFASETTFDINGVFRPFDVRFVFTLVDLVIVLASTLFASGFRDEIERARRQNVLFAWHLSKLLPAAVSERDLSRTASPQLEPVAPDRRATDATVVSLSAPGAAHDAFDMSGDARRYEPIGAAVADGSAEMVVCLDRRIGREVALRRLPAELAGKAECEAALDAEALLQARIDHPGVPPVYDRGTDERGPWFTMQRVKGSTLADLLAGGPPTEQGRHRRLTAFAQVCLTVDFAHACGKNHGALDPHRIVLGEFGEVYVLGWGSAANGASGSGSAATAPSYAAPEQAGAGRTDARADVFALGAILFEMLSGRPLFGGGDDLSVVLGRYDARPSAGAVGVPIPADLDEICAKATAYDPADRYPSARELHDVVEASMARDRDEVLRRALGAERLARATKSAERAIDAHDEPARIEALRELGRALALLPDRAPALRLLERLLASPPTSLPAEVAQEIATQARVVSRQSVPIASKLLVLVALVAFPIVAAAAGVRDVFAAVLIASTWAIAAGTAYVELSLVSRPRRLPWAALAGLVATMATSLLFGPHILGPVATVALTMSYVLGGRLEWRRPIIVLGCVAVATPAVLTWFGVLDTFQLAPSTSTATVVVRGAIFHPRDALLGTLLVANGLAVLIAAAYGARIRDALAEIEAETRAKVLGLSRLLS